MTSPVAVPTALLAAARCIRRTLISVIALVGLSSGAVAQQVEIVGSVLDSISDMPVEGARVEIARSGRVIATTFTNPAGQFVLEIPPGRYTLRFARLGYHPRRQPETVLDVGQRLTISVRLEPLAFVIDPVVASASRLEEKALEAPASVSVIDIQAIEERPALTPIDHLTSSTGMVVATTGLTQHEVVARGFGNVASGSLLALADNRYVSVPSLRINVYNFMPLTNEDVERIELVRGPGSALYGPNSSNGVFHVITRSPFDASGTSVSIAAGERSVLHGQFRHASTIASRLGIKLSGQYMRGDDWVYEDPVEQSARTDAIEAGANPDTLRIGLRNPTIERISGELRVDWRAGNRTTLTTTIGVNQAVSNVELTPLGASQVDDWRYAFVQSRLQLGRLFGQVFLNSSHSGDTYLLQTGDGVTDRSQMWVAQLQHGTLLGSRVNLTYGLDLQRTVPRTDGTITGRNEEDDTIDEAGAYLHSEAQLHPAVRLVAAARLDVHSRLEDPVISPRAALVVQPTRNHTVRLTYNRAFSTPTTNNLFLDLLGGVIDGRLPIPIPVRLVGVPSTGFNFRRDCNGGLCMRSPYTPASLGSDTTYLPADATLLWPVLVDTLAGRGIDISSIPPPTSAEVGTILGRVNLGTGLFEPVSDAADIPRLKPTIDNVIEVGYKGVWWDRLSVGIDLYRAWKNDFVGGERVETPSVFFEGGSLVAYLELFMPRDEAVDLALLISSVPAGTVSPQEARDPWDLLITYRNSGKVSYWGADMEVGAILSRTLAVHGSYSWASRDVFPIVNAAGDPDTIPFNAPGNKGTFSARFRDDVVGLNAEVRGRWVAGYPISSGVYVGDIDAYAVLDATVGYRLPFAPQLTVTVSALNVLDHRHREFVGAPEIGRLVTGMVRAEF